MAPIRSNTACRVRLRSSRSAYVLVAVLIFVGIGAVLSYAFIASHINAPVEAGLDGAYHRAVQAAHTGLNIAIRQIKYTPMTTDPDSDSLEDIWNDHWGFNGEILALSDYDASSASGSNKDLVGIEVRRYADDDLGNTEYSSAAGVSQFNYHPEYYKITCVGVARDKQGRNLAFHPLHGVIRIPRTDWTFTNQLKSSNGYPEDRSLAVFSSAWAGQGAVYIDRSCYIAGSIYSWYHVKIHDLMKISGDAFFDDEPPAGAPSPSGQSDKNGWELVPAGANRLILPSLVLADYGHDDLSYQIDGVTFQAENIGAMHSAASGAVELGASPTKTNPANVVVYGGGGSLTLDAKDYKVSCLGTVVADTIVLTDSSATEDPTGMDFHLAPSMPGFPSIVCNELMIEDNAPDPANKTFIEGPALIRKFIQSERNSGATFRGFIINNDETTSPPSGQGSYKGLFYVAAEEGDPPQPGPYTELRSINGVSYDANPDQGFDPPKQPQAVRLRTGESDIQFSDQFLATHTWPP